MKTGGYGRKDIQFDMLHQSIIVQRLNLLIDMGVILGIETLWVTRNSLGAHVSDKIFCPFNFRNARMQTESSLSFCNGSVF